MHPCRPLRPLFPERPVHLVRQRLHHIGQDVALAGLDVDLGRHAGLQALGVLEAGVPVVEGGPGDEVGDLPLRVLDEVGRDPLHGALAFRRRGGVEGREADGDRLPRLDVVDAGGRDHRVDDQPVLLRARSA